MRRKLVAVTIAAGLVGVFPAVLLADNHKDPTVLFLEALTGWVGAFDPMPPMPLMSEDGQMLVYQYHLETENNDDLLERIRELEAVPQPPITEKVRIRVPDDFTWWEDNTIAVVTRFPTRSLRELLDVPNFQWVYIGVDPSRPPYENENDPGPNPGHNNSMDIFNGPNGLDIGLTFYDNGQFIFGTFGSAVAVADDDQIIFFYPELSFAEIEDLEIWVQTPEGWVSSPIGPPESTLYLGSVDFVTQMTGVDPTTEGGQSTEEDPPADEEPINEEEPTDEPVEEQPAEEQQTEDETNDSEQDSTADASATATDDSGGFPWLWVLAGLAALGVGGGLASRARREPVPAGTAPPVAEPTPKAPPPPRTAPVKTEGPCDDVAAAYDAKLAEWQTASSAMNAARDAHALGPEAGSEATQLAQEQAEAAEQAAWKAERAAWDVYVECLADARDTTRTRVRPRVPQDSPVPGGGSTLPGTQTDDTSSTQSTVCVDEKVEWRQEKAHTTWNEPTGEIEIYMDRTTEQFEEWLEANGEMQDLTPDFASWAGFMGQVVTWIVDSARDDVGASLTLSEVEGLRDRATSLPLFQTEQTRHWVTIWVAIPQKEYMRFCERKWICRNGNWVRTQETRLGEPQFVGDVPIERTKYDCETAVQVAETFERQFELVDELESDAFRQWDELRTRCNE